jgi:hypothetical protein
MDNVERASLSYLQELYRNGELPLAKGIGIEAEHQVSNVAHGTKRYRIQIQEIPINSNSQVSCHDERGI